MQLIDTHCHIHSSDYRLDATVVRDNAKNAEVNSLICVGTDVADSRLAVTWASRHENAWASVGVHPHHAKQGIEGLEDLLQPKTAASKIVAIGEIGLDYHYTYSPKAKQIAMFEAQLQLALDYKLPVIFHVRQAFEDFWAVLDNFPPLKGVVHSFTDSAENLEQALSRDFYIGVNGIVTFPNSKSLQQVVSTIPLHKLLLETDAPYLTPVPRRGKVNEPAYVRVVAEYLSQLYGKSLAEIALSTTRNATDVFHF